MPGFPTSVGRALIRAFVLATIGMTLPARPSLAGRDGPSSQVSLTADRVRHWREDGAQFALLEGHAAIFNGDEEGLRADRAVVRIVTDPRAKGGPATAIAIAIAAEGNVRRTNKPGKPAATAREDWTTTAPIDLSAGGVENLQAVDDRPDGVPLLSRSFPRARESVETTEPRPEPDPALVKSSAEVQAPAGLPELPRIEPLASPALTSAEEKPPVPLSLAEMTPAASTPTPVPARTVALDRSLIETPADEPIKRPIGQPDPTFKPVQFIDGRGFPDDLPRTVPASPPVGPGIDIPDDFGPSLAPPVVDDPARPAPPQQPGNRPGTELDALPGMPAGRDDPAVDLPADAPPVEGPPDALFAPTIPGSRRVTTILARSGPNFSFKLLPPGPDGTQVAVIRGGVNVITEMKKGGLIDIEADSAIIWRKSKPGNPTPRIGPDGQTIDNDDDPMEIYLEGHVVFRQDRRLIQGKDDQLTVRAERFFYDYRNDRFLTKNSQLEVFAPGLIAPFKVNSTQIDGFHPLVSGAGGESIPSSFREIRAANTISTGSRFSNPGYKFTSKSLDLRQVLSDNVAPNDGGDAPDRSRRTTWRIDSRQNFFYMGPVPVFYWPRFQTDVDDLDPPLRQISFRTNNYFGQQVLLDFNGFKVFNIRKPDWIDTWNIDVDYLSARKSVALGSELGWFGNDPVRDLIDPYHKRIDIKPSGLTNYFGYVNYWSIFDDRGYDDLGTGPVILTNNIRNAQQGFTRQSFPSGVNFRGRFDVRHMQSFLDDDSDPYEDARINLEAGILSDRHFLEQYFKRLFDVGLDHEILAYGIKQEENWAATFLVEANPNVFNTETQWAPKLDYYRMGDSLFSNYFNYFQHSGVDWAATHTANDVNNPNILPSTAANHYIPFDPVSNTSGTLRTGRIYTAHELEMPINLGVARVVPYVQGQAAAWDHQIGGTPVGRVWGAAGVKADVMAWNAYPDVESELFNVHGFNHKINAFADFRDAYSNVGLNRIGVQDDLDDNTYEQVRRYFALVNYAGGLLPMEYDPRFLLLRRMSSPIGGSTDIQASIETLHMGIHQRLQTKRGPEGRRHINDYMILDVDTTYFPQASRDNFGKPWGQNQYNYEWFIGDRTSIVSYGWFEFWNIEGSPLYRVITKNKLNPLGLDIITTGININRPPRGNVFLGYSVVDTGLIQTSALNASFSYWMSPKYYASAGTSYDFANRVLLSANGSITRIGADYFLSVGLVVNPLQKSYMFSFEITPRLSPSLHLGSGSGLTRLDSRYAPVQ